MGSPPPASSTGDGFSFGSYGRVGVGLDQKGRTGYGVNVVSFGPRLELPPYLELNLYYGGRLPGGPRWRIILAPAFGGDFFHYTGSFESRFAVRNAYAEVVDLGLAGLQLWAGSRMYRGDDVYLLNFWPLDNLNTVGGGAIWANPQWELKLHGGLNRPADPFQYQTVPTAPRGVGPPGEAVVVDRPRLVMSFKATRFLGAAPGAKISLYGELHRVPEGERQFVSQERKEALPADLGGVVGAQLGGWLREFTFVNLWFRAAFGLAAYGEFTPPSRLGADKKTTRAREFTFALSLNYESKWVGLMAGGYARGFTDAGPGPYNAYDYVEGALALRPHVYLHKYFHVAVEVSYQGRQYGGFDPLLNRRLTPQVFRAGIMPIVAPFGPGAYSRPQIYLAANWSRLNDDARLALFDSPDLRAAESNVFYFGIGAEWWFQSSYR